MHPIWRRFIPLTVIALAISAWHVVDAAKNGQPVWIPILSAALVVGFLMGLPLFVSRPVAGLGQKDAWAQRAASLSRLGKWAASVGAAVALLRMLAWLAVG